MELGLEVQPMGFGERALTSPNHCSHPFSLETTYDLPPLSQLQLLCQLLVKQKKNELQLMIIQALVCSEGLLSQNAGESCRDESLYKASWTTQGIKFPICFGKIDTEETNIIQYLLEKVVYLECKKRPKCLSS